MKTKFFNLILFSFCMLFWSNSYAELIAFYSFDQSTQDLSGSANQHDGTAVNVEYAMVDENDPTNFAAKFNGQDSYIHIPNHDDLNLGDEFTISFLVKADKDNGNYDSSLFFYQSNNGRPAILSKDQIGEDTSGAYNLFFQSQTNGDECYQNAYFEVQNNIVGMGGATGTPILTNPEGFHHVVWRHFDDTYEIWIDGQLSQSVQSTSTPVANTNDLLIGRRGHSSGHFKGLIDELSIYDESLSDTAITQLFQMYNTTVDIDVIDKCSLVAYYPFEDNANDASGNGHDGTVVNATFVKPDADSDNMAAQFNGEDTYIHVPSHDDLNLSDAFTVSFLVNAERTNGHYDDDKEFYQVSNGRPTILSKDEIGEDTDGAYNLFFQSQTSDDVCYQKTSFEVQNNIVGMGGATGTEILVNPESFHHIVWRHYDNKYELWIDGKLGQTVESDEEPVSNEHDLLIGRRGHLSGYFKGLIDELKIYKYSVSDTGIEQLFQDYISRVTLKDACEPLAINVSSLQVTALSNEQMQISWEALYELEGTHYQVWKGKPDNNICSYESTFSDVTAVSDLIPAYGIKGIYPVYTYVDGAGSSEYCYAVKEILTSGESNFYLIQ